MKGAQCAHVGLQGVPAHGIIDTAADIMIAGGRLLKKIATIAPLKKKNLKPPAKKPRTYVRMTNVHLCWMEGWTWT